MAKSSLNQRGFTLIELMVVIGIMAAIGGAVALSIGGTDERMAAQNALANTAREIENLRELAELRGQTYGLIFSEEGIEVYAHSATAANNGTKAMMDSWALEDGLTMGESLVEEGLLTAYVQLDGENAEALGKATDAELAPEQIQPQVILYPHGEYGPEFRLWMVNEDEELFYQGSADGFNAIYVSEAERSDWLYAR